MTQDYRRRQFMKMVGAAGAGSALAGTAGATEVSTRTLDEGFDLDGGVQEALVVFDDAGSARRLETLDLPETYHVFEHLAVAWTHLTADQLETVAGWGSVRRVKAAEELEWHNDGTSRKSMAVDAVHEDLEYRGEDAHVVIIDSGLNASHPGIGADRVEANYRYVDEPTGPRDPFWVDTGPADTDTVGHGQHCAGIAAGDGEGGTQGTYEGMAPKATITSYAVVQYIYLPYVVAAWNHLLGRIRTEPEFDPDVVTNSYGVSRGARYNPNDPVNVATWKAFQEGVLPVFSYGNDGPGEGSGNRFAKAPHVLGVGAAEKTIDEENNNNNRSIVGFSSRGRSDVDNVFYNRDRLLGNLREFFAIQEGTTQTIQTETYTGSVGPGVNTGPVLAAPAFEADTGSSYVNFTTAGNADLVDLTLSLDPEGQWVRMRVYEKQGEEWVEVAQMREEVLKQHDTLSVDVEGGTDYLVELEPEDTVTADYTIEYTSYARPDGELSDARPITLYRPGVSAHGNAVLSTQDKADVLGPLGEAGDSEPFYGRLSGTSMSGPAAAGIAMLVQQAYRAESGGDELSPADLIRVIEATAADHNPDYTTINTGAGFVDAEAAVETAEALARGKTTISDLETGLKALVEPPEEVTPPETVDLDVTGSRSDDASVFTAGQTDRVQITVDEFNDTLADEVQVFDRVPDGWTVAENFGDVEDTTENEDGSTTVDLGTVSADKVGNEKSVTRTYFAEAPEGTDGTGTYTFGPAAAEAVDPADFSGNSDKKKGSTSEEFGGTDTNTVAGADTEV